MDSHFSTFVIKALVDVITGGAGNDSTPPVGVYRSGAKLEQFFLGCGVDFSLAGMSRVPAVTEVLRRINVDDDGGEKIKRVLLSVSDPREYLNDPGKAAMVRKHINRALEPDNLAVAIVGGASILVSRNSTGVIVEPFVSKVRTLDFDTVQADIARALTNMKDDPEDAVTAASSLIEAVCRSILIELKLPLPVRKDIDSLFREIQVPLDLSPGRTDLPAEVEQDVRQILSGLTSVAKGIGALRTHGGDAHGREKGFRRIDSRIAGLAINAASSIALFLIETWERKEQRSLPQHEETV